MDETNVRVCGQLVYLYRAVDKAGQTVDFWLSRNRDVNAAKSFLRSAMNHTRVPAKITLDASVGARLASKHRCSRLPHKTDRLERKSSQDRSITVAGRYRLAL